MKKPEHSSPGFEVQKTVRLGTDKAPAQISVQTEERKLEIAAICEENNWASIITVDPSQDENLRDLSILQERSEVKSATTTKAASRNDPCPCGSGKKYKKCCGA